MSAIETRDFRTDVECQFPIVSDYTNKVIRVGDYVFDKYCSINKSTKSFHYLFDIMESNDLDDWYRKTAVKKINDTVGFRDYWKLMIPIIGPKFNIRLNAAMVDMWISPFYDEICRYILIDHSSPSGLFDRNRAMIVRYHAMINEVERLRGTEDESLITLVALFMRKAASLTEFLGADVVDCYKQLSGSKRKALAAFLLSHFNHFASKDQTRLIKKVTRTHFDPEIFRRLIHVPSSQLKFRFYASRVNTPEKVSLMRDIKPTWDNFCDAENNLFSGWDQVNGLRPAFISPYVGGARLLRHFNYVSSRYWRICNQVKLSYEEYLLDSFYGYYSAYRMLPNRVTDKQYSAQLLESETDFEAHLRTGALRYIDYRDSMYDEDESFGLYAIKRSNNLIGYVLIGFSTVSDKVDLLSASTLEGGVMKISLLNDLTNLCRQSINYVFEKQEVIHGAI